jgi:hypothetical protein
MDRSGRSRNKVLAIRAAIAVAALATGCDAIIGLTDVPVPADASADGSGAQVADAASLPEAASDAPFDGAAKGAGDASPDASPCGDTQGSSANCGRCGHDCLGAACVAGACQTIALVPVDAGVSPTGLAQDESFLYWTDYGHDTVTRTDKSSGVSVVLSTATFFPRPIAVDDAGIYWGDTSGVWRCDKLGCSANTVLAAEEQSQAILSLAIDDVNVYWTEASNAVLTATKAGAGQPATTLWEIDASAQAVTTDGQRVYFTASDGVLRGGDVDGRAPFALGAASPYGGLGVAVDSAHVYWSVADPTNGTIRSAPLSTLSPATNVASALNEPATLATDGASIYWLGATAADGATGAVYGCTIAACTPTLLATGSPYLASIVIDALAVYYTDEGTLNNGGVFKVAR